jgi:hypothetical protein
MMHRLECLMTLITSAMATSANPLSITCRGFLAFIDVLIVLLNDKVGWMAPVPTTAGTPTPKLKRHHLHALLLHQQGENVGSGVRKINVAHQQCEVYGKGDGSICRQQVCESPG